MAKIKYVGDPNDNYSGPDTVEKYGMTFVKGEVMEVPEKTGEEKAHLKKLQGNSHFIDMSDTQGARRNEEVQKQVAKAEEAAEKAKAEKRKREEEEDKRVDAAIVKAAQEGRESKPQAAPVPHADNLPIPGGFPETGPRNTIKSRDR